VTEVKLKAFEIDLVNRLRQMLFAFRSSYAKLTDKRGIWLKVGGLDNNDRYPSEVDSIDGMMKPLYERLFEEWERSADKENLTREDFLRMQRAMGSMPGVTAAFQTEEAGKLAWRVIELMGLFLGF